MDGYKKLIKYITSLLLMLTVAMPAFAALKGGQWHNVPSTQAINGTVPVADNASIPVYQGSIRLDPAQSHNVEFTAMPNEFSIDSSAARLILNNPRDTEGDLFVSPTPMMYWQDQILPAVSLIWADAATPDTPLNPQPVSNRSFCSQNMAGRSLVAWPELSADQQVAPLLHLLTMTGVPNDGVVPLAYPKVTLNIAAAQSDLVTMTASHYDNTLKASKTTTANTITLTVTTKNCGGAMAANIPFTIKRGDAINRQNGVNNVAPVVLDSTELTTTVTEYRGVTNAEGVATIQVTQPNGPGVKTPLTVSLPGISQTSSADVIFTVLTSPDVPEANMWGHMVDTFEAYGYTFSRPKLAAEASNENATVVDHNETWSTFTWEGADQHCAILPGMRQFGFLATAIRSSVQAELGWPVQGDYYWSSLAALENQHYAVDMTSNSEAPKSDSATFLVSCVDKAAPDVEPQITLTPDIYDSTLKAAKVMVGDSITTVVSITDNKNNNQPLAYYYFSLHLDNGQSRKGDTDAAWEASPVHIAGGSGFRQIDTHNYEGVTDANGQATLTLTQPGGKGVKTRIMGSLRTGFTNTDTKDVMFTTVTSPDSDKAHMWGHMRGFIVSGNIFKRPVLADETSHKLGSRHENNEDWALFDQNTSMQAECGLGHIPRQTALETLYSTYPGNQIGEEHGWPTVGQDYLSAAEKVDTHFSVNLGNGSVDSYPGFKPNYLSCSGNELVTRLLVDTDKDTAPDSLQAKAKVGDTIVMTVRTVNAINNAVVPYASFTITKGTSRNRQGSATGFTDATSGAIEMNDVLYGTSQPSMVFSGTTNAQGITTIRIEQPQGAGLDTSLVVAPESSRIIDSHVDYSVIFTVPTSPDVASAQMWGHMDETIKVDSLIFNRPKLMAEVSSPGASSDENNETWVRVSQANMANINAGGCGANMLPRRTQLSGLYSANSNNTINSEHGWPTGEEPYWSSTPVDKVPHYSALWLNNGLQINNNEAPVYVSCLATANPVASTITLDVVNSSQWNSTLNAAKLKKGETLQVKVTVKDASGNPMPDMPFTLKRGDGYTRTGEQHTAGSGDGIVAPVVVEGTSLNDSATLYTAMTGSDGSKNLNITRPDTHGTKTAITAALYSDSTINAAMDTIFTVVTSPDSAKAKMWGHMADTLSVNGITFKRPLLFAELNSGAGNGRKGPEEDNEIWALFNQIQAENISHNGCGVGALPTLENLQLLYSGNTNNAMKDVQGWPLLKNYYSSTPDNIGMNQRKYKTENLSNGTSSSVTETEQNYLTCQVTPVIQASQIILEPADQSQVVSIDGTSMLKTPKGERLAIRVTTKDAQGNPVGNTAFTITRPVSVNRQNAVSGDNQQRMLQVDDAWGHSGFYLDYSTTLYGVTGVDGSTTFSVGQNASIGLKTVLTATLDATGGSSNTLPLIYTVITSPDSSKANQWGHMPETFTSSAGITFKRPQLAAELMGISSTTINNESWGWMTKAERLDSSKSHCGEAWQPLVNELQGLYADHPGGDLVTVFGLPVSAGMNWWAYDQVAESNKWYDQSVNLSAGGVTRETSTTAKNLLMCLTEPHAAPATIELTSSAQSDEMTAKNGDRRSAVAKKGEFIPLTVTVKDSAGNPVPYARFTLSRGNATSRSGTIMNASYDDLLLQEITPVAGSMSMTSNSSQWAGTTGTNGSVTFTVNQDTSWGLATPLTAQLVRNRAIKSELDVVFTVLTSPDTSKAAYWGHMPDTFTSSDGTEFLRPLLQAELSSTTNTSANAVNNEIWYTWTKYPNLYQSSNSPCDRMGMPTLEQFKTLYNDYVGSGGLTQALGLPVGSNSSWGSGNSIPTNDARSNNFQYINLNNGSTTATNAAKATAQMCLVKRANLNMTLSSSALDVNKSTAVAKKGEVIPLTVTVTDGSGNAAANVTVRLMRELSRGRSGDIVDSSASSNLALTPVSPVSSSIPLIYTSSGNTGQSIWYGVTGNDGKIEFELTQNNTLGSQTSIGAILADDYDKVSSLNTRFTVITSPDTDKAQHWGHMPETVTTKDGVVFERLKLFDEVLPSTNLTSRSVNGENWPALFWSTKDSNTLAPCEMARQPTLSDLQSLFNSYDAGKLTENTGWPLDSYNWFTTEKATSTYKSISMNTGDISTSATRAYQACLVTPRVSVSSIILSSPSFDEGTQAAMVKKGDALPLIVTVKDSGGNPVPNVTFNLKRGDAAPRNAGAVLYGDVAAMDDLTVQPPTGATVTLTDSGNLLQGTTGSDGTATFMIKQDNSPGYKTPLTVTLNDNINITATMDAIFTVITSPNVSSAHFWGHMADMVMVSGKLLHRPLLTTELPAGKSPVSSPVMNYENWATAHVADARQWDIEEQCGNLANAPTYNDLAVLHSGFSSLGWPSSPSFPYLSAGECGMDEGTGGQDCSISVMNKAGLATCFQ
ncbi:RatA-like protein [Escherichia coli]|nr:RatA-like protein [Escherichia coli]